MLTVARVLGGLIKEYFKDAKRAERDCRLVVPGLTDKIAREMHEYLHRLGLNSYLVVGDDCTTDESKRWIRPIGLTSKRIGSFIAIIAPGQLAHVHDSIHGSGGAIRSLAFSEEWPWIDNGSGAFRFNGPVIDCLVTGWTNEKETQQWLREFIISGLLKVTRTSSRRGRLLLEDILSTFKPSHYSALEDIRLQFLYHAGVPCPSSDTLAVADLIANSTRLCHRIIKRCQKEDDLRRYTLKVMVPEIKENEIEQREICESLNVFFDGLGMSGPNDPGFLAFRSCWGDIHGDTTHWLRLRSSILAKLFEIKDLPTVKISCKAECSRGIISEGCKAIATFFGDKIHFQVSYNIPIDHFSQVKDEWRIVVASRGKELVGNPIQSPSGKQEVILDTVKITGSYKGRLPLRFTIVGNNDVHAEFRLALHLCGEQRQAFVVVEPDFDVIDPYPANDNEEIPDQKFDISDPVHLYLFHFSEIEPTVYDENEKLVEVGLENPGICRTMERIDPSLETSGQAVRRCIFGAKHAVLCLESQDMKKGEFTIEDELRVQLANPKGKYLKELAGLFAGEIREPYPRLGNIDDSSRQRILLASLLTNHLGWKPLLTNLLSLDNSKPGEIGNFINYLGAIDGEGFNELTLPGEALELLSVYSKNREAILKKIESSLSTRPSHLQHPIYATHPVFVAKDSGEIEELLVAYLKSYLHILNYLENDSDKLEWAQLFVLAHLDSVVHWGKDNNSLRNALVLVGPWHPMVLVKRFLVQSSLFARMQRLNEDGGKNFRQLVALLGQVHGFRWLPGVSSEDRSLEPIYVSSTSDPGWHIAVKTNIEALAARSTEFGNLFAVLDRIRVNIGLFSDALSVGADHLASSCLANYMRSFPSRRVVGVRVANGYCNPVIVKSIDRFLHSEEGPTDYGKQLPGGVRLYLQEPLGHVENVKWVDPPISVYAQQGDIPPHVEESPDIHMLQPAQPLLFRPYNEKMYCLPRALGLESVFFEPLRLLTEGQSLVPRSITFEFQVEPENIDLSKLGELFIAAVSKACFPQNDPIAIVQSIDLPHRLDSPWAVTSGEGIDPAILVKYVQDGITRSIQERALWDYRVDLAEQKNSYYILSVVPRSFLVTVNSLFGDDIATGFIEELGKIGIAIGGEALKSGRHALGVVGLVGAVRLLLGKGRGGHSSLVCKCTGKRVVFLIPVDSFASFFGYSGLQQGNEAKRTDLLVVQLTLPDNPGENMQIQAFGVESKFVSGTFSQSMCSDALAQARSTLRDFRKLVKNGLLSGSIPERLGLLSLIRFGLRISTPSSPREISENVNMEQQVYEAILKKRYELKNAKHDAVLVTTEMGLRGAADSISLVDGLWIRLNKNHWPGVSNTTRLDKIYQEVAGLFKEDTPTSDREGASVQTGKPDVGKSLKKTEIISNEIATGKIPGGETPSQSSSFCIGTEGGKAIDKGRYEAIEAPIKKLMVGVDSGRRSIYYDPQSLVDPLDNLNIMITGSSGTGKTQFLKYLVCCLRQQGKNVFILDFKNDFASDRIFTERAQLSTTFVNFDGLPYNPLIPYPVKHPATGELFLQCGQHIAGVANILKKTYGLGAQQQASVKNAIVDVFSSMNIPTTGSSRFDNTIKYPDFSNVGDILLTNNMAAYNRLDPLFTLGLFRKEYRNISFHSLVCRSVIVDLSQIPSDEIKTALAQLIVMCAHSYYNSQLHSGNARQFLVFDEAHRVLNSEYILRLVRECRAYGVGTMLSSQYPSDFPLDISGSMATKIIHGNGRDIDKAKDIIKLLGCEGQEAEVSNLDRFQAYIDNRHYPHTIIRTMNYPLFLVWAYLKKKRKLSRIEIPHIEGLDITKLPVENLIRQLERLALVEERNKFVHLLGQND